MEVRDYDWMKYKINRLLISTQYTHVFNLPPKRDWKGFNGAVSQIQYFPEISLNLIKRVDKEIFECESRAVKYDATRN